MPEFFSAAFWEFWQNLPVIVGLCLAVWLWAQGKRVNAILCMVAGGTAGALVIRFTERLLDGGRETVATTLTNVLGFGVMPILFVVYLSVEKRWSNWRMDLLLGGLAGAALAVSQGLTASRPRLIGVILHGIALALSGGLVLVAVRSLKGRTLCQVVLYSLLIAAAMTLGIIVLDYTYLLVL
jgi:hypothetical protein